MNKLLGRRIKERREELGINQLKLARSANVSKTYICQLEQGVYSNPGIFKIQRIAAVLKTTIADLIQQVF